VLLYKITMIIPRLLFASSEVCTVHVMSSDQDTVPHLKLFSCM